MTFVAIFFCEDVCDIMSTRYVMYVDEFLFDVFANGIVAQLDVTDGSCRFIFTPLDACYVIVEYVDRLRQ